MKYIITENKFRVIRRLGEIEEVVMHKANLLLKTGWYCKKVDADGFVEVVAFDAAEKFGETLYPDLDRESATWDEMSVLVQTHITKEFGGELKKLYEERCTQLMNFLNLNL